MTHPKFLVDEEHFRLLPQEKKDNFLSRFSYMEEIAGRRIGDNEDVWAFISSLQIDVWAALSAYGDLEKNESILSVERWITYYNHNGDARAAALSRAHKLVEPIFARTPTDNSVREWIDDWSASLGESLRSAKRTSDPEEGILNLVIANFHLYLAMTFFSWLRLTRFPE